MNVLDTLAARLASATAHNHATERPPVIVLWPDGDRKWEGALSSLRGRLPNLWTLGDYAPEVNQGPAAWVKWRLGQVATGEPVPLLYLPGVQRLQFRTLEDFPEALRPVAELQFRGTWWTQQNGKDWTPLAFLASKAGGLGLSVAEDADTVKTIERLVPRILGAALADVKKPSRLEAGHFVSLLISDLEGDLLTWLNDPEGVRKGYPDDEWAVFRDFVRRELGVDLDKDGPIVAAEHLVQRNGGWAKVWSRYAASVPSSYSKVHVVLEKAKPTGLMFDQSTLPKHNDEQETALRNALAGLVEVPEPQARAAIRALEKEHGKRRDWVWHKLGRARMAAVLEPLVALAEATEAEVGGSTPKTIADWYSTQGHLADDAAIKALAMADHADGAAIRGAVRALYLPWLQRAADRLREVVQAHGYPAAVPVPLQDGTCLLFADGLRWDTAMALADALLEAGFQLENDGRWVAFPPVTGTSKPDVSPIRGLLLGGAGASDFTPTVAATGKTLDSSTFRKLMGEAGVQVLEGNQTGDPAGRGWTEFGDIDKYGHKHGCKTARHVEGQLRELEQRVAELLAAGWREVRVTTDHGWLLVPGGMPAAKVPAGLAETRWGRCAMLKSTSKADLPSLPWAWDPNVEVTYAPGVCAFYAGTEYAHGGLTMQECYTPVLTVTRDQPAQAGKLGPIKWTGMRCRVKVESTVGGLRLDLRAKVGDAATSVLGAPTDVGVDGNATALVPDDQKEGILVYVILLAPGGAVLDKCPTTIGGDQ
jgi:hypothetical protein